MTDLNPASENNAKIAVIGRPNVGKSSIFNRLVGRRTALVHDTPGITRDRKYAEVTFSDDSSVTLIDTAGFEEENHAGLTARMNDISRKAMAEAAAIVFVIDGSVGVTGADEGLARLVQQADKPVIFVANKADTKACMENSAEFYALGFDAPLLVSAEHNIGFADLLDAIKPYATTQDNLPLEEDLPKEAFPDSFDEQDEAEESEPKEVYRPDWLRLTIVGRPNAGKSTLVNQLLQDDRMMTGEEAGLTRESNASRIELLGKGYELIDTAGLRKKARVAENKIEGLSASDAIESIARAHGVLLMMDATQPWEHQDKTIAAHVVGEGKPLVIVLNKWDLVEDKKGTLDEVSFMMERNFSQVRGIPLVTMSALNGFKLERLLKPIEHLYTLWNSRIATGKLNRFLQDAVAAHPPPLTKDHRPVKMKYMTQSATRPPTFKVWCNRPQAVPVSYVRYLSNVMREVFHLEGIVFRIHTTSSENPYR
mgnify:CR=1 FL=1